MALTEEQAAQIILVRSVEESDKEAFSSAILTDAVKHAGSDIQGTAWLLKRTSYLIARLPERYQSVLHLAKLPGAWALPVSLVALAAGFATNLLGPAEKIHVVRNPVALFVGWNLLVYLGVLFLFFQRKLLRLDLARFKRGEKSAADEGPVASRAERPQRSRKISWILEYILPGLWKLVHALSFRYWQTKKFAETATRFWSHWLEIAGPLVLSRWRQLLHFGAISLAIGATLGMYFRGLFQGYEVIWASTYIRSEKSVSAFIDVVFGPAFFVSGLLGQELRGRVDVARLLGQEGDPAGPWIHLFAVTVILAVVLPRAALAAGQWFKMRRLRGGLPLLFDRYYGEILASPIRSLIEQEVREGMTRLAEDVASYVRAELYDRQIVPSLQGFRDNGGRIVDLRSEIRAATEGFAPAMETFIAGRAAADFQERVSSAVERVVKGIGGDFYGLTNPKELAAKLRVETTSDSADAIGYGYGDALGAAITVSVAAGLGTISGGFGQTLGLGIITALLGTTGPIGFLLGAFVGIVAAGAAWWFGREKIAEFVETVELPGAVVRATLWESRFQQLVENGRKQCHESVKAGIEEQTNPLVARITDETLIGVRRLWEV